MSDDHLILTLDQGTTSSRAILFDRDARVRAVAQRPITQLYPASGWVDHDANEIWETTRACMAEVLAAGGVSIER
ncbi:MAG: glycerol kinase, partial [Thermomicrobiales bacterium]|nr:glycerol kinase [Thermomicrobiales bacterium]